MLCFDVPPTVAFATGAEKSSLARFATGATKNHVGLKKNRNAEHAWLCIYIYTSNFDDQYSCFFSSIRNWAKSGGIVSSPVVMRTGEHRKAGNEQWFWCTLRALHRRQLGGFEICHFVDHYVSYSSVSLKGFILHTKTLSPEDHVPWWYPGP